MKDWPTAEHTQQVKIMRQRAGLAVQKAHPAVQSPLIAAIAEAIAAMLMLVNSKKSYGVGILPLVAASCLRRVCSPAVTPSMTSEDMMNARPA
jgi:hypothetical protein